MGQCVMTTEWTEEEVHSSGRQRLGENAQAKDAGAPNLGETARASLGAEESRGKGTLS